MRRARGAATNILASLEELVPGVVPTGGAATNILAALEELAPGVVPARVLARVAIAVAVLKDFAENVFLANKYHFYTFNTWNGKVKCKKKKTQQKSLTKSMAAPEELQMLQLHEWVRARPDTFVGAIDPVAALRWVFGKRADLAAIHAPVTTLVEAKAKRLRAKEIRVSVAIVASPPCESQEAVDSKSVCEDEDDDAYEKKGPRKSASKMMTPRDGAAALLLLETSPAAEKIVDEILQNALDRQHKDASMTRINVSVDAVTGTITVRNNGVGMPVTKPARTRDDIPDEFWPTILCTRIMTGGNFSSAMDAAHYQGGRNGIGMKATSILSSRFSIAVGDSANHKSFKQVWTGGLVHTDGPAVGAYRAKAGYVEVSFQPDMAYFKQEGPGFSAAFAAVVRSRVWELTAVADARVGIWLDGERLPVRNLTQFVSLLTPKACRPIRSVCTVGERAVWDVSLMPLQPGMAAGVVAFVNGIRCCEGKHVTFLFNRLSDILEPVVQAKTKQPEATVTEAQVRRAMFVVLVMWADGPRFKSQSKDTLDSPAKEWGFKWVPEDDFKKRVVSAFADVVSTKLALDTEEIAVREAAKTTGGRHSVNLPKYEPAGDAGKAGTEASLILTEGDSAMGMAMAGRAQLNSRLLGVYPLKGKPLNCRDMDLTSIVHNEVLANVAKILGLEYGKVFETEADLRRLNYKHLVLLADQDFDGGHIVGLVYNWVQYCWPSLLRLRPDFIRRFATPLIIANVKGKAAPSARQQQVQFLSAPAFRRWLAEDATRQDVYKFSYYKGLGGHSSKLGREYFKAYAANTVTIMYDEDRDADTLENFFNEKRANVRKALISAYNENTALDYSRDAVTATEFLMSETLGYCHDNVPRGIPGLDGCKRTQRKLLFACLELMKPGESAKLTDVAMKCGERAKYHHGEVSLYGTMVSMAQTHPGSNNVNLLIGESQMGSRLYDRGTFTAPRYLSTGPETILAKLIRKEDNPILTYRVEEGKYLTEPTHFLPVVPLDLINGAIGVTSGWSTKIPAFHPVEVIRTFCQRLLDVPDWRASEPVPWFDGLTGPVLSTPKAWVALGLYSVDRQSASVVHITLLDLPFGKWAHEYHEKVLTKHLIRKEGNGFIARIESDTNDRRIHYTLVCDADLLEKALKGKVEDLRGEPFPRDTRPFRNTADASVLAQADAFYAKAPCRYPRLEELLDLAVSINKTNMFRLDAASHPVHFRSMTDIVDMYATERLQGYRERIQYLQGDLARTLLRAQNRLRYVLENIAGTFVPNAYEETADMWAQLSARGYVADEDPRIKRPPLKTLSDLPISLSKAGKTSEAATFHLLTDPGDGSKTKGACRRLEAEIAALLKQQEELARVTPVAVWLAELEELRAAYEDDDVGGKDGFATKRAKGNYIDTSSEAQAPAGTAKNNKKRVATKAPTKKLPVHKKK